jgi:hypothetical protein
LRTGLEHKDPDIVPAEVQGAKDADGTCSYDDNVMVLQTGEVDIRRVGDHEGFSGCQSAYW